MRKYKITICKSIQRLPQSVRDEADEEYHEQMMRVPEHLEIGPPETKNTFQHIIVVFELQNLNSFTF